MEVVELLRYPVKSLQGERLTGALVARNGIVDDRSHALRDLEHGVVLTGRRDPVLLFGRGVVAATGEVQVELPDGRRTADPRVLTAWVGKPVALVGPSDTPSTYETPVDPLDDDSEVHRWSGPPGSFHDSRRTQLSLVATGDLAAWDVRRFRPNVVVAGESVDHLVGARVRLGTVELDVVKRIDRCVMVTRPQPGGIERDLDVLRTIRGEREMFLGVGALVARPGRVRVGDVLERVA